MISLNHIHICLDIRLQESLNVDLQRAHGVFQLVLLQYCRV